MHTWSAPAAAAPHAPAHDVAGGLVDGIARDDFAVRALATLNRALPVAWWTVYRVVGDEPPRLHLQASHAVPDIALACWRIYRSGVYRDDMHFAQACERAGHAHGSAVMTHCVADDFSRAHRERIYEAHSLSERLSLVAAEHHETGEEPEDGREHALLAVNLYRHRAQARFAPAELDRVLAFAPVLLATVQRHLELDGVRQQPAQRLKQLCPQLTERELAVCERLLRGLTFDGIAADLQISVPTAKTYRNRAFERLRIHHRNELFALALPSSN
ncbi:MAG TPA: LuxR C-terminal-related transcriptional regulator [Burkholderiaceae bacterium]|nr:LuxR C-terminal-related transcriptional regulator [Burkholderiaceae bacterium]